MTTIREVGSDKTVYLPKVIQLREFLRGYSLSGKQVIILHRVLCMRKAPVEILRGMYSEARWADGALNVLVNFGLLKRHGVFISPSETFLTDFGLNSDHYWSNKYKLKVTV